MSRQLYLHCFYIPELLQLANDVETNPEVQELLIQPKLLPHHTVNTESQGNVEAFGTANAGTQCVAMILSALVYNLRNLITLQLTWFKR